MTGAALLALGAMVPAAVQTRRARGGLEQNGGWVPPAPLLHLAYRPSQREAVGCCGW
jgi:hypothetical protein